MTSPSAPLSSRRSLRGGRSAALASLLVAILAPATLVAQRLASIDIQWQAPPDCPQEGDVRERIRKLIGSRQPDGHLQAEGTIVRTAGHFRLALTVRFGDIVGTRSIDSSSCEDLAGATAVELALLVHSAEAAAQR